ncbi:MAG: hypothetical protein V2A63_00110 [Patescibacteria group bacterium]
MERWPSWLPAAGGSASGGKAKIKILVNHDKLSFTKKIYGEMAELVEGARLEIV